MRVRVRVRVGHRVDRAQPPVVVQLLARGLGVAAEQVAREVVQREELLGELGRLRVALRHHHVLHDELEVGHHHGHRPEEHLVRVRVRVKGSG